MVIHNRGLCRALSNFASKIENLVYALAEGAFFFDSLDGRNRCACGHVRSFGALHLVSDMLSIYIVAHGRLRMHCGIFVSR
jgi:hypothetical protein